MATPEELEQRHTLTTATDRYNALRMRDALAAIDPAEEPALSADEILEMLALSEVIIRKAGYGRQAMMRAARSAGASWARIGAALGTTKQAAWESHQRWAADPGVPTTD